MFVILAPPQPFDHEKFKKGGAFAPEYTVLVSVRRFSILVSIIPFKTFHTKSENKCARRYNKTAGNNTQLRVIAKVRISTNTTVRDTQFGWARHIFFRMVNEKIVKEAVMFMPPVTRDRNSLRPSNGKSASLI